MKHCAFLLLLVLAIAARAQPIVSVQPKPVKRDTVSLPFVKHLTLATISVGFADYYRANITAPKGFSKNNVTGFAPVYGRLEYGVGQHISLAFTGSYDLYYVHYNQEFTSYNGGSFSRFNTDAVRVFRTGVSGYYHFGQLFHSRLVDCFVGLGCSINNIRHSQWPAGDSVAVLKEHTVSPSVRVGARYYLSQHGSVFADAGYDRQSVLSIGYSCRFFGR